MLNILSKFISILVSFSAVLASLVSSQPTPAVSSTPIPVEISGPFDLSSPSATPQPVVIPTPTPIQIQDVINQINDLKKQIDTYTPEPTATPTPAVFSAPIPTLIPTPMPTPLPLAKVVHAEFHYRNTVSPQDPVMTITTDNPAHVRFSYVVDDGSIMDSYNSGDKDNQRLSDLVAHFALYHTVTIEADTTNNMVVLRAADLPAGHLWFSITTANADGKIWQYAPNFNIWDWNNNLEITLK